MTHVVSAVIKMGLGLGRGALYRDTLYYDVHHTCRTCGEQWTSKVKRSRGPMNPPRLLR